MNIAIALRRISSSIGESIDYGRDIGTATAAYICVVISICRLAEKRASLPWQSASYILNSIYQPAGADCK